MRLDPVDRLGHHRGVSDSADTLGTIATGALLAGEIERAQAGAPALGHDPHEPCANCGTMRRGAYCHSCGQAGHVHRTVGALVHDIAHGVFHFEGKLWATLPLLAWRPGELTRRYVRGERTKFVSPMALFLFSVFLLFAVVSNLAEHHAAAVDTPAAEAAEKLHDAQEAVDDRIEALTDQREEISPGPARDALDRRIAEERAKAVALAKTPLPSPADAAKSVTTKATMNVPVLGNLVTHLARNPELTAYKIKSNAYKYSWALIPLSVPFLWLLFAFRRDVGLYDHAIFATYSLAFMSLMTVALVVLGRIGLPSVAIAFTAMIVPPLHMYRQLKQAYALGRFGASWRTVALLVITTITSALFLSFLVWLGSG